jgi:HK97 family phage portal protein
MGLGAAVKGMWKRAGGVEAGGMDANGRGGGGAGGVDADGRGMDGMEAGANTTLLNMRERKTSIAPLGPNSIFAPFRTTGVQNALPKPTAANLRRFAETPVARRAINCIKDRIACMDWKIEVRRGAGEDQGGDRVQRVEALTKALEFPNETDSFRTLMEQVIEDTLVGGFGAAEIEVGDSGLPVRLYPVDGASIQVNANWKGDPEDPRYAQITGKLGTESLLPLLDHELMYVRLNPRSHTPFGLGKVEVAFESISHFLQAHRYAGRLASNSVTQYALWLNQPTPEQHERLVRFWQDEVEGSGRVPILSSQEKPEVLKFAEGTDADLRLGWQQFLLAMVANAFDLPPMMLGVSHDVNKSTAGELADEAFQSAIVPLAKLVADHLTRDVIVKRLGWSDLRFVWSDLASRDEMVEMQMQMQMLAAGVVTVAEVRAMRGMAPMEIAAPLVEM